MAKAIIPHDGQGQLVRFNAAGWIATAPAAKSLGKEPPAWRGSIETFEYMSAMAEALFGKCVSETDLERLRTMSVSQRLVITGAFAGRSNDRLSTAGLEITPLAELNDTLAYLEALERTSGKIPYVNPTRPQRSHVGSPTFTGQRASRHCERQHQPEPLPMPPTFLPHTCLDLPPGYAAGQLPPLRPDNSKARALLRALCEQVSADGAQVLILLWPDGLWTLLAIDPPADAAVTNALELVPVLLAHPKEMATIRQRAAEGRRLVHLVMRQPHATLH